MPLVSILKKSDPQNSIFYWSNIRVKPILESNPNLDKIFALSRGDLKNISQNSGYTALKLFFDLIRDLKKERFDLAFDFSLDYRYSMFLRLLGVKRIIGFDYKNRGRFLTDKIRINGYQDRHVVEYYLDTLKFIGVFLDHKPEIQLFLPDTDIAWAENFLKVHNIKDNDLIIGIAPGGGASWGGNALYLRWPQDKFASLAHMLAKKDNAKIILFGSADEAGLCEQIEYSLKNKIINTSGKITLTQYGALFKKCNIAICNDAGPLHIAVALGLKTVCICGPVDEKVYGPYPLKPIHRIVKENLPCQPCYKNFRFPGCPYNRKCIQDITVDEVYSAVKSLL